MFPKIVLCVVFFLAAGIGAAHSLKVYFSPRGSCQQAIIAEIKKAHQSIDIAMYYLTSKPIAQALARARERDVRIRIVLDKSQEKQHSSKSSYLLKQGIAIKYHRGQGLMHNKFAIIDGKLLITGSFNWTATAEEKNEENLLIIDELQAIEKYQQRFDYLWNNGRPQTGQERSDDLAVWLCRSFGLFCAN